MLAIGQAEQRFNNGFRLEGGAWLYSAYFNALHRFAADGQPLRYQRSHGAYALLEGPLLKSGSDDERGLSGWLRVGLADPIVQDISAYIGGGVVYTGLIDSRAQDQTGIAINHAILDRPDLPDPNAARKSSETTFELSYRYIAKDWLAVQPDAQFVVHPDGDPRLGTAFVVGVRFSITLTKNLAAKIKS